MNPNTISILNSQFIITNSKSQIKKREENKNMFVYNLSSCKEQGLKSSNQMSFEYWTSYKLSHLHGCTEYREKGENCGEGKKKGEKKGKMYKKWEKCSLLDSRMLKNEKPLFLVTLGLFIDNPWG